MNNKGIHLRMNEDLMEQVQKAAKRENKTINDYIIDVLKDNVVEKPRILRQMDGYYIDENNNRWNVNKYSAEFIDIISESMDNCRDCVDCEDCWNCVGCIDCYACGDCIDCVNCQNCDFWENGHDLENMNFKKIARIMKNEDKEYLRKHMDTLAEFKEDIVKHYEKNKTCVYPCENADQKSYEEIFNIYASRKADPEEYWRINCQDDYKTKEEYIDDLVKSDVITIGHTGFIFWK